MSSIVEILSGNLPQVINDAGYYLGQLEQFVTTPSYVLLVTYGTSPTCLYNLSDGSTMLISVPLSADSYTLYHTAKVNGIAYAAGLATIGADSKGLIVNINNDQSTIVDPSSAINVNILGLGTNGRYVGLYNTADTPDYQLFFDSVVTPNFVQLDLNGQYTSIGYQQQLINSDCTKVYISALSAGNNSVGLVVDYNNGSPTVAQVPLPDGYTWDDYILADNVGFLLSGDRKYMFTVIRDIAGTVYYVVRWDTATLTPILFRSDNLELGPFYSINGMNILSDGSVLFDGQVATTFTDTVLTQVAERTWFTEHLVNPLNADFLNMYGIPAGNGVGLQGTINDGNTLVIYVAFYDIASGEIIGNWPAAEFHRLRCLGYI